MELQKQERSLGIRCNACIAMMGAQLFFAKNVITDEDKDIMAPLKAYLESTGSAIPDRLARHPAASTGGGNLFFRIRIALLFTNIN